MRLIDAVQVCALCKQAKCDYIRCNESGNCVIADVPTIDAVEVVRCKDCIAFGKSPYGHPGLGWCRIYGHHFNPDYYCASGRREVERDE